MPPKDHQSEAFPWPLFSKISGAKYSAVPQILFASVCPFMFSFERPKSAIFTYPSWLTRTFSGFKSLYKIFNEWRWESARRMFDA
jgi:hypothetical protein